MLAAIRALFDDVTPLATDCGRLCNGRCCQSLEGELSGMLLFPGEEIFYANLPDCQILDTPSGKLLICNGHCNRTDRPLSCRMFPLLPVLRPQGLSVVLDARAQGVCPLCHQTDSLEPAFISAVQQAGRMIVTQPALAGFLRKLTKEQDELIRLRQNMLGD